jgi:predicted amidohydrolase YtcJ
MRIDHTSALSVALCAIAFAATPDIDLIIHNGRVVTADTGFAIHQAMAIRGNRIHAVGTNEDILRLKTAGTELLDLGGKMVLPGLIDSHVHCGGAAMTEFDHPIPQMDSVADVLDYIRGRAARRDGQWIVAQQIFITPREQRYPRCERRGAGTGRVPPGRPR